MDVIFYLAQGCRHRDFVIVDCRKDNSRTLWDLDFYSSFCKACGRTFSRLEAGFVVPLVEGGGSSLVLEDGSVVEAPLTTFWAFLAFLPRTVIQDSHWLDAFVPWKVGITALSFVLPFWVFLLVVAPALGASVSALLLPGLAPNGGTQWGP